jgi:hypothetical protein
MNVGSSMISPPKYCFFRLLSISLLVIAVFVTTPIFASDYPPSMDL